MTKGRYQKRNNVRHIFCPLALLNFELGTCERSYESGHSMIKRGKLKFIGWSLSAISWQLLIMTLYEDIFMFLAS